MEKVAKAMHDLVTHFQERGEMFVYTCAFRKTHEAGAEEIATLSDFTNTYSDNLYEAMAFMQRDLANKITKEVGIEPKKDWEK